MRSDYCIFFFRGILVIYVKYKISFEYVGVIIEIVISVYDVLFVEKRRWIYVCGGG